MNIRKYAKIAAVPVGLLVSGLIVAQTSSAAFTAQTQTAVNTWSSGQVTLTNDASSTAAFNASGIVPGQTGSKTISVNYTSGVKSAVKMYAATPAVNDALAQALQLTIAEGGTTVYNGTVADFSSTKTSSATGVGTWTPTGTGTQTYTVTWTLPSSVTSSSVQGLTTNLTFVWEATSQAS